MPVGSIVHGLTLHLSLVFDQSLLDIISILIVHSQNIKLLRCVLIILLLEQKLTVLSIIFLFNTNFKLFFLFLMKLCIGSKSAFHIQNLELLLLFFFHELSLFSPKPIIFSFCFKNIFLHLMIIVGLKIYFFFESLQLNLQVLDL